MAIAFIIWGARAGASHAAPRERRSLWPCTAGTARESAERQPTVIIRVPLVLEASYELYSDACGYSQRYNERVCASINILDFGSSAFGF